MKGIKLVFRCLSYLHFHHLVNISMSQNVCHVLPGSDCPKTNPEHWPEDRGLDTRMHRRCLGSWGQLLIWKEDYTAENTSSKYKSEGEDPWMLNHRGCGTLGPFGIKEPLTVFKQRGQHNGKYVRRKSRISYGERQNIIHPSKWGLEVASQPCAPVKLPVG